MTHRDDWTDFDPDGPDALPFRNELLEELSRGHDLFGSEFEVVARRHAQDDILVTVAGRDGCFAVHLTWKQAPERPPYPRTTWFNSIDQAKAELSEG